VDRGVLIPRLDGAEVADAASGLVTALAPDPWAIEAGVIAGPLGPLLLADLPLRILGATEALGAVQELTLLSDAGELPRGVVCPALRARDVPLAPAAAGAA
jgi:predicted Zn-dependent protease